VPLAGHGLRPAALRRRASRPQLKRDPLGCAQGDGTEVNSAAALSFVRRQGVVLESAHGPVPNLAETVVGAPIRGSWWAHAKGKEIFWLTRAVRNSNQVLVCRLLRGKITYVHRRLWPALVRLAYAFRRPHLAALREVHTARGAHTLQIVPFPRWVPAPVKRRARELTERKAWAALGLERPPGRPTGAP